jgi:hypothetical protein
MEAPLPEGWATEISRSTGDVYYVNVLSNETTYTRPTLPATMPDVDFEQALDPCVHNFAKQLALCSVKSLQAIAKSCQNDRQGIPAIRP